MRSFPETHNDSKSFELTPRYLTRHPTSLESKEQDYLLFTQCVRVCEPVRKLEN